MEKKKNNQYNWSTHTRVYVFRTNLPFSDFSSEDSDDSYYTYSSSSESVEDHSIEDYSDSESDESNEDEGNMDLRTHGANSVDDNGLKENEISPSSDDEAVQRLMVYKESVACLILRAGCQHNPLNPDKQHFMNHRPNHNHRHKHKHNQHKRDTHNAEQKPQSHLKPGQDKFQVRMNSLWILNYRLSQKNED